jgi:Holliday junction resolvase RusA-like endonuclease
LSNVSETESLIDPEEYVLVVPGDPVPWSAGTNPKSGGKIIPGRVTAQVGKIVEEWRRCHGHREIWLEKGRPVQLGLEFYVTRPKTTHYGSGRNARTLNAAGLASRFPTGRPDLSNLVKLAEDALTGLVWQDDDQVVRLHPSPSKDWVEWWEQARTVIRVALL